MILIDEPIIDRIAQPSPFTQRGADLYDAEGRRVAWFGLSEPTLVWVEGVQSASNLRAIADWMETQNAG